LDTFGTALSNLWILASMTKQQQEPIYKEWISSRENSNTGLVQGYGLRVGLNKTILPLCRNSFVNLLNLPRRTWETLMHTRLELGSNGNNNICNKNADISKDASESVVWSLWGIAAQYGESYATHFVRMMTKFKLRDKEKGYN
jgi:hypothetical protein